MNKNEPIIRILKFKIEKYYKRANKENYVCSFYL